MSDKLFDIPEGWELVTPLQRAYVVHPTEFKIYDEDKLIHYFIFVTDFEHFRVFDRVTGEFKKHRKLRKQKMFKSMEAELELKRKTTNKGDFGMREKFYECIIYTFIRGLIHHYGSSYNLIQVKRELDEYHACWLYKILRIFI